MALTPTDFALAGYHLFLAVLIMARGPGTAGHGWVLLACGLFGVLLVAFRLNRHPTRLGRLLHTFYPLMLFAGMYTALGTLNAALPPGHIAANESLVQGWEAALFGGQPSYDLIRRYPSVFLSGLLHLAYFAYYPTILLPGPYLAARGAWSGPRSSPSCCATSCSRCSRWPARTGCSSTRRDRCARSGARSWCTGSSASAHRWERRSPPPTSPPRSPQ